MIALSLAQIADIVGGRLTDISAQEAAATKVTGTVEFDSRAVTSGGLFLALPGARADGHDHAAAAVAAGAAHIQGCVNGYGERTGNCDLTQLIPNLTLKMGIENMLRHYIPEVVEVRAI